MRRPQSPTGTDPLRLRPAPQVPAQMVDGREHAHAVGEFRFDVGAMAELAVPTGVLGQPTDIANGVLFLASDESSFVTGTAMRVEGGVSLTRT